MRFMEAAEWDWGWALKQFDINRHELSSRPSCHVGLPHNHAGVHLANTDRAAHLSVAQLVRAD
jgi:hypothetical protein